ncbi:hypothetical protein DV515_00012365 [Chloebia gouldiae]|uniref:Uncharacterized protein n=1 Tax=Chloebia gouldiae TaxID=44316 RepID=A0A3L8S3R9_CHLGU|nr:hypothetical protein DV515_00012365 [Chloebia gouldiae]
MCASGISNMGHLLSPLLLSLAAVFSKAPEEEDDLGSMSAVLPALGFGSPKSEPRAAERPECAQPPEPRGTRGCSTDLTLAKKNSAKCLLGFVAAQGCWRCQEEVGAPREAPQEISSGGEFYLSELRHY